MLWVVYLMITGKERQMYSHSKYCGRVVLGVSNDAFGSTYKLGRVLRKGEVPTKNYLTWKEFRKLHEF